jgi:hypothetical protein
MGFKRSLPLKCKCGLYRIRQFALVAGQDHEYFLFKLLQLLTPKIVV